MLKQSKGGVYPIACEHAEILQRTLHKLTFEVTCQLHQDCRIISFDHTNAEQPRSSLSNGGSSTTSNGRTTHWNAVYIGCNTSSLPTLYCSNHLVFWLRFSFTLATRLVNYNQLSSRQFSCILHRYWVGEILPLVLSASKGVLAHQCLSTMALA